MEKMHGCNNNASLFLRQTLNTLTQSNDCATIGRLFFFATQQKATHTATETRPRCPVNLNPVASLYDVRR